MIKRQHMKLPVITVKEFATLAEFGESAHNYQLAEGFHSTSEKSEAKEFNFKTDENGNKLQRYDDAILIKTTQKDGSSTDSKTIAAASNAAKTDYSLSKANCADAVIAGLDVSRRANGSKVDNGQATGLSGGIVGLIPRAHKYMISVLNGGKSITDKITPKKPK